MTSGQTRQAAVPDWAPRTARTGRLPASDLEAEQRGRVGRAELLPLRVRGELAQERGDVLPRGTLERVVGGEDQPVDRGRRQGVAQQRRVEHARGGDEEVRPDVVSYRERQTRDAGQAGR